MTSIIVAVLAVVIAAVFFVRWRAATAELQAAEVKQRATEHQVNALDASDATSRQRLKRRARGRARPSGWWTRLMHSAAASRRPSSACAILLLPTTRAADQHSRRAHRTAAAICAMSYF